MTEMQKLTEAAGYIQGKLGKKPEIGLILGSGLGVLAEEVEDKIAIEYGEIPHFPISTVEGHEGKLICGTLSGKSVMILQGRFHYYEGYGMDKVIFPVRLMKLLGIENLLVTNAAGGVNLSFSPGDLMLISDHILFYSENPLRGRNMEEFGPRFNDMSDAYTGSLREMARETAAEQGLELKEGVYAFMGGPSFETPAEIRMARILGIDAVGMSTAPEVITAVHAGMKIIGISCISNMAAGILPQPLNHQEVMETGEMVKTKFIAYVKKLVEKWPL